MALNNKRIAKNTIFLYIRMLLVMFITLFTTRELLSALGVEDYGVYNVVCGFVSMFSFLNTSLANGTQRFYNYEIGHNGGEKISKIFSLSLLIQIGLSLLILSLAETVGVWYLYNKMIIPGGRISSAFWIFQFALGQLFVVMLTVPYSAAIMAYESMNFYAVIGVVDAILKLCVVFLIRSAPLDGLIFYGLMMLLISFLDFILNWLYCHRRLTAIRVVKAWDTSLLQSLLTFSGWNIFGSVSHMMQTQGVNLILNAFWGTIVNAANGVAIQISSAVNSLTAGFVTAVRPQMIKSYASGNEVLLKKMYYSSSKLTFYLVMILTVPLVGEINTVLDIWLGKGRYPSMTPIFAQLTMIMALCNSYAMPSSIIVHASGKMKKFQLMVSAVTLSIVPISYFAALMECKPYLILLFSIFVTLLAQITRLILIREIVNYSVLEYVKLVFVPTWLVFFISVIATLLLHVFNNQNIIMSFLNIVLSVMLSLYAIYAFGIDKTEKKLLKSFVRKK